MVWLRERMQAAKFERQMPSPKRKSLYSERHSYLTWATLKRVVNAVLLGSILFAVYVLISSNPPQSDESQKWKPPSHLAAQENARRLDEKYLPHVAPNARVQKPVRLSSNPGDSNFSKYNATIVLGRLRDEPERVQWVFDDLVNIQNRQIYIVDDPNSELPHLSRNHGREAAVYLTYIIDNYDKLDDITFFWHTDKIVWHNNLLLHWDSVQTINRMDRENIIRQGYVPSRCDHWPGCPEWIKFNPSKAEHRIDPHRLEEMFTPELFNKMFPNATSYPPYFAGTCCSQFAVSRDTIRKNPIETYKTLLEWILEYSDDDRSGMVFEYTWPYIFLGRGSLCPSMQDCYCRTYNLCMQNHKDVDQIESWNALRTRREEVKWQVTFVEDAIQLKKAELTAQGASKSYASSVVASLQPELQRLTTELDRLAEITWNAREQLIHRWRLGVPPVGW